MLLDGKLTAERIQNELKEKISKITGRKPCLAVLLIGSHASSHIYVARKTQACETVGILSIKKELPETISEVELLHEIKKLNENPQVDGILVQLPLPSHMNPYKIIEAVNPDKDVDGFHPVNAGKLLIGMGGGFVPCTPLGIKVLLERYSIDLTGKRVLILGRSNIVGKPLAALLMQNTSGGNATVTVAHRHSKDLQGLCLGSDIIIAAIGQAKFVTADMVKQGAVIVDVGINKVETSGNKKGYQIVGDVDFDKVNEKCAYITPVPGGVGPMTIAMLLQNTFQSYLNKHPQ